METVDNDMRRQVIPCLGLWEYTHTNEDGVMQYRLVGVTEDDVAAALWAEYHSSGHVIKVRVVDSMQEFNI